MFCTMVHLNTVSVNFDGQGRWSDFKVTGAIHGKNHCWICMLVRITKRQSRPELEAVNKVTKWFVQPF